METLLHISASPRGRDSESLTIARAYLDTVALERPDVRIEEWDLWDGRSRRSAPTRLPASTPSSPARRSRPSRVRLGAGPRDVQRFPFAGMRTCSACRCGTTGSPTSSSSSST